MSSRDEWRKKSEKLAKVRALAKSERELGNTEAADNMDAKARELAAEVSKLERARAAQRPVGPGGRPLYSSFDELFQEFAESIRQAPVYSASPGFDPKKGFDFTAHDKARYDKAHEASDQATADRQARATADATARAQRWREEQDDRNRKREAKARAHESVELGLFKQFMHSIGRALGKVDLDEYVDIEEAIRAVDALGDLVEQNSDLKRDVKAAYNEVKAESERNFERWMKDAKGKK